MIPRQPIAGTWTTSPATAGFTPVTCSASHRLAVIQTQPPQAHTAAIMDEVSKLRSEVAEALAAQHRFNASVQESVGAASAEMLNLRADCLLLRTVVAALWGQASPAFRDQIQIALKDPAKAIFSTPLSDEHSRHLIERGKVFQDHLDQARPSTLEPAHRRPRLTLR